ncbi:MAG TPA: putative quinol monooxygenase [Candidatus Elarobacter sp.]|jgi:quinol monooxygenase YgiN|nr:putative quinol monooxygenase [Candidatus Elarobacter sp.]
MLINAVTYTFPPEKADEVERLLRELREASLREDGCMGYEVCRGDGDAPGTFVLYERWRDQAALDAHMAEEHFVRLGVNGFRKLATNRTAIKGRPVE